MSFFSCHFFRCHADADYDYFDFSITFSMWLRRWWLCRWRLLFISIDADAFIDVLISSFFDDVWWCSEGFSIDADAWRLIIDYDFDVSIISLRLLISSFLYFLHFLFDAISDFIIFDYFDTISFIDAAADASSPLLFMIIDYYADVHYRRCYWLRRRFSPRFFRCASFHSSSP